MTKKVLYIIRHGKSSWEMEFVNDIDRPLTDRGISNALTMAKRLIDQGMTPDWFYSSPADRALHTAIIMAREMEIPEENIFIKRALYMADEEEIKATIDETPDDISGLAIFGHNPSFTSYANRFLKEPLDNLPTAGVVVLTFELNRWCDISPQTILNEYVDYPKKTH